MTNRKQEKISNRIVVSQRTTHLHRMLDVEKKKENRQEGDFLGIKDMPEVDRPMEKLIRLE